MSQVTLHAFMAEVLACVGQGLGTHESHFTFPANPVSVSASHQPSMSR